MNNFESILLISSETQKNDLNKIIENFEKVLNDQGGKIIAKEDWGLRDLAYKIQSTNKAFYCFYQININSNNLPALKKIISQDEKIIRHMFIKVKEHCKLPTKMIGSED